MKISLWTIAAAAWLSLAALPACNSKNAPAAQSNVQYVVGDACPFQFNADSAYAFVEAQCAFGPRVPNSEAHRRCGDYLVGKFRSYGLDVVEQTANLTAWDGTVLAARNIIASYAPDSAKRILLCAHWDSRPWCDADPDRSKHRESVMGANDGASGVAVMLEVARLLQEMKPAVGIDLICFDAEDYGCPYWADDNGYSDGSDWCLGSQYWAKHPHKSGYSATYGILLDMVGGFGAQFCYEGYSLRYAQAIVGKVWTAARAAGAEKYFPFTEGGYITDDHVPLNETAAIPTIDVIAFHPNSDHSFAPTWHTTQDTPENISRETLKAVGQTMLQVIHEEK